MAILHQIIMLRKIPHQIVIMRLYQLHHKVQGKKDGQSFADITTTQVSTANENTQNITDKDVKSMEAALTALYYHYQII